MVTYNDIPFPETIRTDRIISAFTNPVNPERIRSYIKQLEESDPPPIKGYPTIIDECDVGHEEFMTGELISEEHVGQLAFYVTDGHHRTCAAIEAGKPWLWTEPEEAAFTRVDELEQYRRERE
jgi:hypothetical protein